jgi:hypothetical protein
MKMRVELRNASLTRLADVSPADVLAKILQETPEEVKANLPFKLATIKRDIRRQRQLAKKMGEALNGGEEGSATGGES